MLAKITGRSCLPGDAAHPAMRFLIACSRAIDALNTRVGRVAAWLVLAAVLLSAGNAASRYALNLSSNAWLELQWYLFSAVFLLGAGYALLRDAHVRVDVVSSRLSARARAWLDIIGIVAFLMPMALVILYFAWPMFTESWASGEMSSDAGGLPRWPVKLLIPLGFALLVLQAVSELIKRVALLREHTPDHGGSQGGKHAS
jgi:TRAP-type mannitol/chloroaromatic compound transport system permease small subunit